MAANRGRPGGAERDLAPPKTGLGWQPRGQSQRRPLCPFVPQFLPRAPRNGDPKVWKTARDGAGKLRHGGASMNPSRYPVIPLSRYPVVPLSRCPAIPSRRAPRSRSHPPLPFFPTFVFPVILRMKLRVLSRGVPSRPGGVPTSPASRSPLPALQEEDPAGQSRWTNPLDNPALSPPGTGRSVRVPSPLPAGPPQSPLCPPPEPPLSPSGPPPVSLPLDLGSGEGVAGFGGGSPEFGGGFPPVLGGPGSLGTPSEGDKAPLEGPNHAVGGGHKPRWEGDKPPGMGTNPLRRGPATLEGG
ncbi:vegetative cell wall protein gp1-like [Corvus hawaiiensis]|uniref:vegetative cell wall protein gp1-like n=1 Tax=Corvus hawaiiensis TaxID=134902 RepID=UPI0020184888|nr:vegetative cell wall protein gp1-like [Corvus hawaiiensis]